ncbi:MAG: aspartate kinase, partial [Fibrobacter sp.]|nr:aspartate kinase [Fibrobacter sp.]
MKYILCKFGGSSVATSDKIQQILKIMQLNPLRRCIVLSAPGKAPGYQTKVTDLLIQASKKALENEDYSSIVNEITERFISIYEPLQVPTTRIREVLEDLTRRLSSAKDHAGKFRDLVVAAGEDYNCKLFADFLNIAGVKASYISPKDAGLIVTPVFGDAQPIPDVALRLAGLKRIISDHVIVFPGFFGYTPDGDVATFSRGGSDLTGAIVSEALDVAEYENWTDVDGIFSAHPHMVSDPEQIPALTYREMRELSYIGFNVLHEEAVRPVMRKKIPIRLRNTNNVKNEGTLVVSERLPSERDVIGVASGGGYCSFTLQKFLMNREKGFGRRLLSIFEELD